MHNRSVELNFFKSEFCIVFGSNLWSGLHGKWNICPSPNSYLYSSTANRGSNVHPLWHTTSVPFRAILVVLAHLCECPFDVCQGNSHSHRNRHSHIRSHICTVNFCCGPNGCIFFHVLEHLTETNILKNEFVIHYEQSSTGVRISNYSKFNAWILWEPQV